MAHILRLLPTVVFCHDNKLLVLCTQYLTTMLHPENICKLTMEILRSNKQGEMTNNLPKERTNLLFVKLWKVCGNASASYLQHI